MGGTITEYVFSAAGQRVSEWNGTTRAQLKGKYYWGGKPVAYYAGGAAHFEHQDWLGTERMRTTYNGGVEGSYISQPFGDGQATLTGTDTDANHYAQLDHDTETATDHAQFRQYSNAQGRWLAPDPYSGSYDFLNPQSMNRYAYVLNIPFSYVDPLGQIATGCQTIIVTASGNIYGTDIGPCDAGGDIGGDSFYGGGGPRAFPGAKMIEQSLNEGGGGGGGGGGAPNNAECDNACQLAHAFNKTGVYSLTSVCFPVAFYGASAAGATVGVAAANYTEVYAATVGDSATWYGRIISWISRMRPGSAPPLGVMVATAGSQVSQFCSSH